MVQNASAWSVLRKHPAILSWIIRPSGVGSSGSVVLGSVEVLLEAVDESVVAGGF